MGKMYEKFHSCKLHKNIKRRDSINAIGDKVCFKYWRKCMARFKTSCQLKSGVNSGLIWAGWRQEYKQFKICQQKSVQFDQLQKWTEFGIWRIWRLKPSWLSSSSEQIWRSLMKSNCVFLVRVINHWSLCYHLSIWDLLNGEICFVWHFLIQVLRIQGNLKWRIHHIYISCQLLLA